MDSASWTGGLEKIGDIDPPCFNPCHNPPGMIVLQPGVYKHTCPSCGKVVIFTVPQITC